MQKLKTTGLAARIVLLVAILVPVAPAGLAQSSPSFSTETPASGTVGSIFVVLLPILNTGTGTAASVQVTSATLSFASLENPTLPLPLGTLEPNESKQLNLQFDSRNLLVGSRHLLTVRGTYHVGAKTLAFAVNRFVTVSIPSYALQTELERWVALDAVQVKFSSLSSLDDTVAMQVMLSFLQSRREFVASGIHPDASSVWARFADGQAIIIAKDRPRVNPAASAQAVSAASAASAAIDSPTPLPVRAGTALASSAAVAPSGLPQSNTARLLNTLGDGYVDTFVLTDLFSWLIVQDYIAPDGASSSVASLKTVGGDGVFYITSHGGFHGRGIVDDPHVYALWTSTRTSLSKDLELVDDLFPPEKLVRFLATKERDRVLGDIDEYHYAITSEFVKTYWKRFSANSFVYIDACNSSALVALDFKKAVFDKGASVYAGWTSSVDDFFAGNVARFVFDRLLGANKFALGFEADGFKTRPFDYLSVAKDLQQHNLVPSTVEFLEFTANQGNFGVLAPSISHLVVDESKDQLTVYGIFGSELGQVTIGSVDGKGGVEAGIKTWATDHIVVDLPRSGAGSAGEVTVSVRAHKSNAARLTEWRGNQFTFTSSGDGSLQYRTVYSLHLRADIRRWREQIHNPPREPSGTIFAAYDSTASFVASGTAHALGQTDSLSGSGDLRPVRLGEPANRALVANGTIDNTTHITFVLAAADSTNDTVCKSCAANDCVSNHGAVLGPSNSDLSRLGLQRFMFTLDADTATLQKNSFTDAAKVLTAFLCGPSGDERALRKFQWGPVEPTQNTAPDKDSAR